MPPENGPTRREELLAVATKLFAARGYHGTRMDDVFSKSAFAVRQHHLVAKDLQKTA